MFAALVLVPARADRVRGGEWPPPWNRVAEDAGEAARAEKAVEWDRARGGSRDLAPTAHALLRRAASDPDRGDAYTRLAQLAAPEDAAPRAFRAVHALSRFRPVQAVGELIAAFGHLAQDPWFRLRGTVHGVLALCLGAWAGAGALFAWGLCTGGRLAYHDYTDVFPWWFRRYTPIGFAVFSVAVLSLGGVGPALFLWAAGLLIGPYLPLRGRWAMGLCLAAGAMLPAALGFVAIGEDRQGKQAWALYRVWKGGGAEMGDDLGSVFPPNAPRALYARARISRRAEDYPTAALMLEQGLQAGGDPGRFRLEMGNIRFLQGDYAGALISYEQASDFRPKDPTPWFNRHVTLLSSLDLPGADAALERARSLEAAQVERFQRSMSEGSGTLFPISDPLPVSWIFEAALTRPDRPAPWASALGRKLIAPTGVVPPWLLAVVALLVTFMSGFLGKLRRSHRCPSCGSVVCPRCGYRVKESPLCSACWAVQSQKDADAEAKDRQKKAARAWAHQRVRWDRWGRVLVPGWSRFMTDAPITGGLVALLWTLGVGWMAAGLLHPAPLAAWGSGPWIAAGTTAWLTAHLIGAMSAARAVRAKKG